MLDRSRPYEQIIGWPGVHWGQDGRMFNFCGQPVNDDGVVVEQQQAEAEGAEPEMVADADRPLEQLHWKTLNVLLEQYGGGPYTTREAAIAFLRGQHGRR